MPYNPRAMPAVTSVAELQRYVEDELRQIALELSETTALELRPVFREPDNPRDGMIVHADGTVWNPGGWRWRL